MLPQAIDINDFNYELLDERIARYPADPRDSSKLLIYNAGKIHEGVFTDIIGALPSHSHLVFNNTRVIPARLFFKKNTGALIEVFLLNPVSHQGVISQAMEAHESTIWHCIVGNKKKWKEGQLHTEIILVDKAVSINAKWVNRNENQIEISWQNSDFSFAEIVKASGQMPLPPYLNRETEQEDSDSYQTVYARNDGAVAAPTAGLHFTENVLKNLSERGITQTEITLHVGAGTFQPVKVRNVVEHHMHSEQIVFNLKEIEELLHASAKKIIPVGTTSMRSLESLYWYGVKLLKEGLHAPFQIDKLYPYQFEENVLPDRYEAFEMILRKVKSQESQQLVGQTEIFILPGYKFRVCEGIITNFHQPKSTLLLLISALIGEKWKEVYDFALQNEFRFLSYGDSSLLLP